MHGRIFTPHADGPAMTVDFGTPEENQASRRRRCERRIEALQRTIGKLKDQRDELREELSKLRTAIAWTHAHENWQRRNGAAAINGSEVRS